MVPTKAATTLQGNIVVTWTARRILTGHIG